MVLQEELTSLGLSSEESKVYLSILELGGSFVSAIARRAKVNRSTCYHTLENLVKKGLVSSYQKGKVLHFTAEDPNRFMQMAEEKMRRTKDLIPQLASLTSSLSFKPKIRFYARAGRSPLFFTRPKRLPDRNETKAGSVGGYPLNYGVTIDEYYTPHRSYRATKAVAPSHARSKNDFMLWANVLLSIIIPSSSSGFR